MKRFLLSFFLVLVLILSTFGGISLAQSLFEDEEMAKILREDMTEQMVYGLSLFNGRGYSGSFASRTEDTIYAMADQYSVISPKITFTYYWPITRRYMAGWQSLNEEVEGVLEIMKDGEMIETLKKRDYAFHYSQGYYAETSEIFLDEDAQKKYQEYKDALDAYYDQLMEYYDAQEKYRKDLDEFFKKLKERNDKGLTPEQMPIEVPLEPKQPTPPRFYTTEPVKGFIVKLPVGEYSIRLRGEDGTLLEGSEKKLTTFLKRRSGGIGYEIIPQDRWTKKEASDDPSEIIYIKGKNVLYFRPFHQDEFNDLYYSKLEDPQNSGKIESYRWVHMEQEKEGTLELLREGEVIESVKEAPYYVQRKYGVEQGFEIVDFDPEKVFEENPTFVGYKLNLDLSEGREYKVRMLDSSGKVLPGSEREIRPVGEQSQWVLYGPGLLSVIASLSVFTWRRRLK